MKREKTECWKGRERKRGEQEKRHERERKCREEKGEWVSTRRRRSKGNDEVGTGEQR